MRFLYVNSLNIYPQDRHLIDGLRALSHEVFELHQKAGIKAFFEAQSHIRRLSLENDAVIVGYTSPLLVLAAYFATRKKIVFNATHSQYESNIVSRKNSSPCSFGAFKWWLLDFLSFHLSSKVLVESDAQKSYIHSLFFISNKKLVTSYSGLNEKDFFLDQNIKKRKDFTVLFRGRFLPESGILTVLEAAKKLENLDVKFLVIGHGFQYREVNTLLDRLKPKNLQIISEQIEASLLREHMLSCHISLGQMAIHPRLDRTLPCKLFESLALRLPYVTGRNKGVLEVLENGKNCITVNQGDAEDLVQKIIYLKNNPEIREKIADAGYHLYKERFTSEILARDFLKIFMP